MNDASPAAWFTRILVAVAVMCGAFGSEAQAQSYGASSVSGGSQNAPPGPALDMPVEVTSTVPTVAGVAVTMVNRSSQVVAAYLIGGTRSADPTPTHFDAVMQSSGLEWQPGQELTTVLAIRDADASGVGHAAADDVRVVVRAVVMADGRGYGDRAFIERTVREWDGRRSALRGALTELESAGVPADDQDMQALIDRVALRMARVPGGPSAEQRMGAYIGVIAGLKRLQHRELGGTDRLAREMTQLTEDLRRQLAGVPGTR